MASAGWRDPDGDLLSCCGTAKLNQSIYLMYSVKQGIFILTGLCVE
jgi:hypothetical protein